MTKTYLKEFDSEVDNTVMKMILSQYLPIEFGVDIKQKIPLPFIKGGLTGFLGRINVDEKGLYLEYERQES